MAHISARLMAVEVAHDVDELLQEKVKAITILATGPKLIDALRESNARLSLLPEEKRLAEIGKLNAKWKSIEDPSDPFIQEYLSNSVAQRLRNLQNELPDEYGEIFLTTKYGSLIATTDKLTTLAHRHKYWWKAGYNDGNGRIFFDDRGYDDSVGAYVLGVVAPVMDAGEIVGILKSNIRILGALKHSIGDYSDFDLNIVRSKGLIVLEGGHEPLTTTLPDTLIPELGKREAGSTEISIDGKAEIVAFAPIGTSKGSRSVGFGGSYKSIDHIKGNTGEGWLIVHRQSVDDVLAPSKALSFKLFFVGFFLLLLLTFGVLLVGRKLSESEKEIRTAFEEAKYANHSKSIFLANMSHELRTPINSINGFAEMMALETFGPLPEKYKEYAELINGSGIHLLRIINNVLDMAKIEAGKVELATEYTDMGEIIAEAVFMLGGQANDNNITFLTEVGTTHTLKVDPLRVKQALVNVISNALKFTPGGTVTLSVTCDEKSHNLIVSDTGIGMAEKDIEIALTPFGQAEGTAYTRRFEGTGLGLPLAKQLVELHGGNLNVESEPGAGTTVIMSFPLALCQRFEEHQ